MIRLSLLLTILSALIARTAYCDESAEPNADEAAIRQQVAQYVEAFNKHDAQAVANFWSPEAVYTNRISDEEVVGREAITEQFKELFEDLPEVRMEVNVESVQFVSPNVAVEHGTTKWLAPNSEPEEIDYSAVYVKREGKWLLDRVTDQEKENPAGAPAPLKALEWLIGEWVDQDDEVAIKTECHWTKNESFLTRSFQVSVGDQVDLAGIQVIGWDPIAKQIRSWTFDSDGGFAEGVWKQMDDRWTIQNKGWLANGSAASVVNIIRPVDDNSFTWQSIDRTVAGDLLPNVDEVLVVREGAAAEPAAEPTANPVVEPVPEPSAKPAGEP